MKVRGQDFSIRIKSEAPNLKSTSHILKANDQRLKSMALEENLKTSKHINVVSPTSLDKALNSAYSKAIKENTPYKSNDTLAYIVYDENKKREEGYDEYRQEYSSKEGVYRQGENTYKPSEQNHYSDKVQYQNTFKTRDNDFKTITGNKGSSEIKTVIERSSHNLNNAVRVKKCSF